MMHKNFIATLINGGFFSINIVWLDSFNELIKTSSLAASLAAAVITSMAALKSMKSKKPKN